MKINYKIVSSPHYIVGGDDFGPDKKLRKKAAKFWERVNLPPNSDEAVIATHNKKLIGFFRYRILSNGELDAEGTWVEKKYRRKGIAKAMWKKAIRKHKAKYISVTTVSRMGHGLVRKIAKSFKKLECDETC